MSELDDAMVGAVRRVRQAHALNHVPTSVIGYCGENDGISATYCETGILLAALARREIGSRNGSETPESTLPTHDSHNTAGIGTGVDERA